MKYKCFGARGNGDWIYVGDVDIKNRPKSLSITQITKKRGGYDDLEGFCPACLDRLYDKGEMAVKKEAVEGKTTYDLVEKYEDGDIVMYPGRSGDPILLSPIKEE